MKNLMISAALLVAATAAFARTDAIGLVPNDAVSVGVVKLAELRSSPLSGALFQQTAHATMDADAAAFLQDAGLQPTKDIDMVVFATSPRTTLGNDADVLIALDGRFNVERLGAALASRGAVKKNGYFLLPEKESRNGQPVVAFPDAHLALIGSENAVTEALASRASGGTSFF